MSTNPTQSYNNVALPITEAHALKDVERLLQDNGYLNAGETIPVLCVKDTFARSEHNISFYVENNTVIALSARDCALTALPASLDQLTHLQQLDVTDNQLSSLPESL